MENTLRKDSPLAECQLMPSPGILAQTEYRSPSFKTPVDLKLNSNEGPTYKLPLERLLACSSGQTVRCYPSKSALEALLAARLNIAPEQVIVTAGGDEALDRAFRAILSPVLPPESTAAPTCKRELITTAPTFEMIPRYACLAGALCREVPWFAGEFPVEEVLSRVNERTAAIAVVSPNNPTGAIISPEDLRQLASAAPQALMVVDLAYVEFADFDLTQTVLELPNAVAVRTLSKAWGAAGLRVGYAVGPSRVIQWMQKAGSPYPCSGISLALAEIQLKEKKKEVSKTVKEVVKRRQQLELLLADLGVKVLPSQANFVLARFENTSWVCDALAGLGIGVRIFPNDPQLTGFLRITIPGGEKEYKRLEAGLSAVIKPEVIIFDMDGVLADVKQSYREAILQTASAFGLKLSSRDIAQAKAGLNSNNDWMLTYELLKQRGVSCCFEDVKNTFEALYQGTKKAAGLWCKETLLPNPALLKKAAAKLPLAILTGRPRADAERFLKKVQIAEYFSEMICMEDAPLKPAPEGVLMLLDMLGVRSAWMLGDAPDDMAAAKAAAVVPLGVQGPDEAPLEPMFAAGASRIIENSLEELEELLNVK